MEEKPTTGQLRARFLNIYRERDGKFRCSEIGFEIFEIAHQLGIEHGDAYIKTVYAEWRE